MDLREELGRALTSQEVGELFGIAPRTVRKYSDRLGGVEIAPGCLRFFENRIRFDLCRRKRFGEAFCGGAELSKRTGR